jgi:hypothetical protein
MADENCELCGEPLDEDGFCSLCDDADGVCCCGADLDLDGLCPDCDEEEDGFDQLDDWEDGEESDEVV